MVPQPTPPSASAARPTAASSSDAVGSRNVIDQMNVIVGGTSSAEKPQTARPQTLRTSALRGQRPRVILPDSDDDSSDSSDSGVRPINGHPQEADTA